MTRTASLANLLLQTDLLVFWARAAPGSVLLQHQQHHGTTAEVAEQSDSTQSATSPQTCAELVNMGSHFAVEVEAGTPSQKFNVVADTGSNLLIVPSCYCQEMGWCGKKDRCFMGTDRSSSFHLMKEHGHPLSARLSFGSGVITGVLAREVVRVGGLKVNMTDGILLMTNKLLNFDGPFEGIMGLGIPSSEDVDQASHTGHRRNDIAGSIDIAEAMKRIQEIIGGARNPFGVPLGNGGIGHVTSGGDIGDVMKKIFGGVQISKGTYSGDGRDVDLIASGDIADAIGSGNAGGVLKEIMKISGSTQGSNGTRAGNSDADVIGSNGDADATGSGDMGGTLKDIMKIAGYTQGSGGGGGGSMGGMVGVLGIVGEIMKHMQDARDAQDSGGAPMSLAGRTVSSAEGRSRGETGILEQGNITRFAICFNEGSNGVLRLGQPEATNTTKHASVGVLHWGLGFHGISVAGSKVMHMEFCNPKHLRENQETPCGAIPDSGTTMITGPQEQVAALLSSICGSWPRCAKNHTAMVKAAEAAKAAATKQFGFNPFDVEIWSKEMTLRALLADCGDWLHESAGLDELPDLHFRIAGGAGTSQSLILPAWAYVFESVANASSHAAGNATKAGPGATGGRREACEPAFQALEFRTRRNGPIWILGTSFFYEYNVHYDLSSKPPSMAFQSTKQAPCGSCRRELGLVATGAEPAPGAAAASGGRPHRPRRLSALARGPSFAPGAAL